MTDEEIRALVREVLVRRAAAQSSPEPVARHGSHAMFVLTTGADEGGPCLIEPSVGCTHCGYCKSFGH